MTMTFRVPPPGPCPVCGGPVFEDDQRRALGMSPRPRSGWCISCASCPSLSRLAIQAEAPNAPLHDVQLFELAKVIRYSARRP